MTAIYTLAIIVLILSSGIAQADQFQRFTALGSFSNYRFTEEHQYGAEIELWREGANLLGLFSYSEGLAGDTPTGLLEKVSFDPTTGKIAFSVRLTTGLHFCKAHNNVPSKDLFRFEGILSDTAITGTLRHADALHPEQASTEEEIVLKKTDDANFSQYRSRKEWETVVKDILRFRGPKW